MSEQSAKPYLIRAICEWCADNALTPYLAVKVNSETRVPMAFVKNGEIVLNVSATATRKLTIDNGWVQFSARFNGNSQEVSVPMVAVTGVFAKETGYGFAFAPPHDPATSLAVALAPRGDDVTLLTAKDAAKARMAEIGKVADSSDDGKQVGKGSGKTGSKDGAKDGGKPARPSHLQVIK